MIDITRFVGKLGSGLFCNSYFIVVVVCIYWLNLITGCQPTTKTKYNTEIKISKD